MRSRLLAPVALAAALAGACAPTDEARSAGGQAGSSGSTAHGGGDASGGAGGEDATCTASQPATAADRYILGQASPYPADATLESAEAELAASPAARRDAAWRILERALAPVTLAAALPAEPDVTVPRFRTWYAKDDLDRVFHRLYGDLGAARRAARDRFSASELDQALAWNPAAVLEDPAWSEDRLSEYLASLDTEAEIGAIGGISRVGYSPGAARHYLHSYPEIVACDGVMPPPEVADAPTPGPRRVAHHAATLTACERRSFGPYFVGEGEELLATVGGAARLSLVDDDGVALCEGEVGEPCRADGPSAVHVVAIAERPGEVTIDVDYREADPAWSSCLAGAFPIDAAVVKADWRRVWPGEPLPTFDTSPAALEARRSGAASWDPPDGTAEPGADAIYTVTTPAGATFRLAGLHLMTKELDHWVWVSLFWSADPDGHLGAGRPASIDGVWRNYQMCVVTTFTEPDGEPSWCSNPYIEEGDGNAATNCIGCHQHGGTGLTSELVLAGMPAHGTTQIRNNFPADYAWAQDGGDRLLRLFADEVAWWDAAE